MDTAIFLLVVASRFLVPLAIPKFPLPAIVVALVLDAADQTIFAAFDTEPDNYQVYDKALDVYYLAIAYASTLRNWTDGVAFRVGQFLWYYRLIGVVAFELSEVRALLIIFPNTFEYFFIAYEFVRVRWESSRLSARAVIGTAAAIWVFIKLPQEWWIHIAQLDVTDVLGNNPWVWPVMGGVAVVAVVIAFMQRHRVPVADWSTTFHVDAHPTTVMYEPADRPWGDRAFINHPLLEKTLFVGLVAVIFVQLLDEIDAGPLSIVAAVAAVVVINSLISTWLALRGTTWDSTAAQFGAMAAVNVGIAFGARMLLGGGDDDLNLGNALFLLALLTLLITLYDRYRTMRFASMVAATPPAPVAA